MDPLEIKSGPPLEGPVFGSFIVANLLKCFFQVELISLATAPAGILNWGGPFLRACFLLRFEDQKKDFFFVILNHIVLLQFP